MTEFLLTEETIQSITTLAERATGATDKVSIVPIPGHPRNAVLIVKADGTFKLEEMPTTPRATKLLSVDQVTPFVSNAVDNWEASPTVYYSPTGVTVRLADGNLRPEIEGHAQVDFKFSEQFKLLSKFASDRDSAFLTHPKFLRMLRLDLDVCFDAMVLESVLRSCAAYESEEGTRVASTVTRNRESLGREIMSELRAANGEIPEDVILQVRIYKDPALLKTRRVHCKLETDPTGGGRFALLPYANELDNAIDAEMSDLGDVLRSAINGNGNRLPAPDSSESEDSPITRTFVPIFYGTF